MVPVIRALRHDLPEHVLLSVDTFHAAVAEACDRGRARTSSTTPPDSRTRRWRRRSPRTGASLVITHSAARAPSALPRPHYDDVVARRCGSSSRIAWQRAREAGIARERIVLDPGPDLNKSTLQTLEVLRDSRRTPPARAAVLAALSRKDVVGESLGLPKQERLEGSLAAAAWTVRHGARILRVHDVQATVRFVRMLEVLDGWRDPAGPLVHNT